MDRAGILGRLGELVAAGDPEQQFVVRLCDAGRRLVGAEGGSISINSDEPDARMTLAVTDELAAQLENLQDLLGEGPCREAHRLGKPMVTSLEDSISTLWPAFSRSALETLGPVTVHCFPMRTSGRTFGAYSVYTHGVLSESREVVQFLADTIGTAVLHHASESGTEVGPSRTVVYQATGMVAVQLQIAPDDALALLRAHAFAHATTLEDIASHVVERRLNFRSI
jgi:hypothetical protein